MADRIYKEESGHFRLRSEKSADFMRFIRSAAAFAATLCLAFGMLFSTAIPAGAEELYTIDEVFSLLKNSMGISENVYNNYESISEGELPIGYQKTENPGYLALGGAVAYGYGADGAENGNFENCYANRFADFLGYGNLYENRASSLHFGAATVVEQVKSLASYVKKADVITFQAEASLVVSECIGNIEAEATWSKYVTDAEFLAAIQSYRQKMKDDYAPLLGKNAKLVPQIVERFLYECVAYSVETINAVKEIRAQNPDAAVLLLGMYNPLQGLEFTAYNQTVEIDVLFDKVIRICNAYLVSECLKLERVAFVDVYATSIPGFENMKVSFEKDAATYLADIQAALANQYANNEGHSYIFERLCSSLCTHKGVELSQTEAPQCYKEGKEKGICGTCGEDVTRSVAKLPHSFDNYIKTEDATCQKAATLTSLCSVCGEVDTMQDPAGPSDHEFDDKGLCIYCDATCETTHSSGVVVVIIVGSVAILCGGGFFVYKMKFAKKKKPLTEENSAEKEENG